MTYFLWNNIWCLKILENILYDLGRKTFSINTSVDSVCKTDMANFDIMLFLIVQTDRGPARRGAHIPNIRSENSKGNFFSVCTSTKRNACNCHGCSTSPTDKWRSGFKIDAWRRRSWTETDYSITHPTLFFRGKKQHCAVAAILCSGTDSVYRLSWLYIVFHAATALLGGSIQVRGHVLWFFQKKSMN